MRQASKTRNKRKHDSAGIPSPLSPAKATGQSLWRKAWPAATLAFITVALCATAMLWIALPAQRESLMDAKRDMMREFTASVWGLLADYDTKVTAGELSAEQAQQKAKEQIRAMRYGEDRKDYFWINDANPQIKMVMHPHRPDLEGTDVTNTLDNKRLPLFQEIRRTALSEGQGFVEYSWQWQDDPVRISPKVSHVRLFKPWNWIIGTGVYVEDVQSEIVTITRKIVFTFSGILLLILALSICLTFQAARSEKRRLQAAEKLRHSEERLQLALGGADLGTWDWDMQSGRLTIDSRWAGMLGFEVAEIASNTGAWESLVHPDDWPNVKEAVDNHVTGKADSFAYEYRLRHKAGGWVWVLDKGRITDRDESGNPIRMCGTHLQITDRKAAEVEREQMEAQLRHSQKMEAVGQLAGGIAHDFNNILQAVLGYCEMTLAALKPDHRTRPFVEEILAASHRAKKLVSQLLAFSRRQVLEMERLDMNQAIADWLPLITRLIGEHIALNTHTDENIKDIRGDRGQIEQILTNLCVNARDAMPEGGEIDITTQNARLTETFCATHPWAQTGQYVLLSVSDTGCGMDSETLSHAFEPFFTRKEFGKGTGLGLATVYGLVMQHEGLVDAHSEINKGTTINIYLPVAEPIEDEDTKPSEQPEARREHESTLGGSETILLAEDNEMVLRLAKTILEQAGYNVLTAGDGEEAIRVFEAHADEIDLAVLDVVMPKLGGRAVFNRIRETHPEISVLFSSGYSINAIHTNFILDEGLTLIQKPYQQADLLAKVREMLETTGTPPDAP